MSTRRWASWLGLLVLLISPATFAGYFTAWGIWQKPQVKVCFGSAKNVKATALSYRTDGTKVHYRAAAVGTWEAAEKRKIKEWITAAYSPQSTGVVFEGWEDCGAKLQADEVVLLISTSDSKKIPQELFEYGRASIGLNAQYPSSVEVAPFLWLLHPAVVSKDLASKGREPIMDIYWRGVVLHEFGHVAGLLHEHGRPEVISDESCKRLLPEVDFAKAAETEAVKNVTFERYSTASEDDPLDFGFVSVLFGEYDANSIMNYCRLEEIKQHSDSTPAELSSGDRAVLKKLYRK